MGKTQIPLVNVPLLKSNRTENNGKLLRRPQRRQPEPLQQCLSPVSSPEMEDRHNLLTQRDVGAESHTQDAIVDQWLMDANTSLPGSALVQQTTQISAYIPAGHTTPHGPPPAGHTTPHGPPPNSGMGHHVVPRPSIDPSHAQLIRSTELSQAQMQVEISNAYHNIPSRPMPTASAKQLLRTTIHAGPEGLPPPEPRKPRNVIPFESILEKGPSETAHLKTMNLGGDVQNDPALTVSTFAETVAEDMGVAVETVSGLMFSKANFRRLTQMIHEKLTKQNNKKHGKITRNNLNQQVAHQDLPYRPCSHAVTGSRVPQTQILIQMASMLTEQIQATTEGRNIRALIRPFPKYTPSKPIDEMPRAEIILYEQSSTPETESDNMQLVVRGENQDGAMIMRHTSEKHFMDSKRNRSPFNAGEGGLDPIDIAVLDALVTGGAVLSLKAHFIDMMPDISPITNSLRYLNLSFNNFTVIPPEVLSITHLEVLKLRNNPIREIPEEIQHLKYLRTFEVPFCLISEIPDGLLTLNSLQYLDMSYNKLTSLPRDMKKLTSLQVFFVEGNQLVALPCSCLVIPHLRYVRVRNNFMHPIFWPDYMKHNDTPQKLEDLAGLLIKQLELDTRYGPNLPQQAKDILDKVKTCDCCHGPLVGEGLTLIRPGSLFGVRNVPFMFKSCSPYCAKLFMANKANLIDLVDAEEEEEE